MTQIFSEALTTGFVDLLAGRVVVDNSTLSIQRYLFVNVFDAVFTRLCKYSFRFRCCPTRQSIREAGNGDGEC